MDVETQSNKATFRGKLYVLGDDSTWQDSGLGYTQIVQKPDKSKRLLFKGEQDDDILLESPVFPADTYSLQGESSRQTIITWEDPETQKDWALSFEHPEGAAQIYEVLSKEQGTNENRQLPLPTLQNISDLQELLHVVPPVNREPIASECGSQAFLDALIQVFHTAEDLGTEETLVSLWHVTKGMFLLSNQRLTERLLREDVAEDIMGMLEYDDGHYGTKLGRDKRNNHRKTLKSTVSWHKVVDINDEVTLVRIHLCYRLQYLKDVVLARLLDDAAFASLTQMIHDTKKMILDHLQRSNEVLPAVLEKIRGMDRLSLGFLQELVRDAKVISPMERSALYEKTTSAKMFEALKPFLQERIQELEAQRQSGVKEGSPNGTPGSHVLAIEIILACVLHDVTLLRKFIASETPDGASNKTLLNMMTQLLLDEEDGGIQSQISETIRVVMDPATLEQQERNEFLDVFYEHGGLDDLVVPLRPANGSAKAQDTPGELFARQLVCELVAFAVAHHGYRAKAYVVRNNLPFYAQRLMASSHKFLQLAPVRLLKAIVVTKDDAYHRYLTKNNMFALLFKMFEQNLQIFAGDNLIVSVTLELLEFIRINNFKVLVSHLCTKYLDIVEAHKSRYKTLEGLLLKHQQNLEYEAFPPEQHASGGPIGAAQGLLDRQRRKSPGRDDSDDEGYFESLDEDDDDEPSQPTAKAPVAQTSTPPDLAAKTSTPGDNAKPLAGLLGAYGDDDEDDNRGDEAPNADSNVDSEAVNSNSHVENNSTVEANCIAKEETKVADEETMPKAETAAAKLEVKAEAKVEASVDQTETEELGHNRASKRLKTSE